MKVLLINGAASVGGANRAGGELLKLLLEFGHDAKMFVAVRSDGDPPEVIKVRTPWERYLRIFEPDLRYYMDWRHIGANRALKKIKPGDIDVLHLHNLHGGWLPISRLQKLSKIIPTVWTLHDEWVLHPGAPYDLARTVSPEQIPVISKVALQEVWAGHPFTRAASARVKPRLPNPQVVVSPSNYILNLVRADPQFATSSFHQMPYGLTMLNRPEIHAEKSAARKAFGLSPDAKVVLILAAHMTSPYKGVHLGIEAISKLQLPGIEVLQVGNPGHTVSVPHRLINAGYISDEGRLAMAYRAADVFVVPSVADNFPYVVLEAMACRTPLCAFSVGGIIEQLGNGTRGLLAPCPDTDQLARNIQTLLTNRALADQLTATAFEWVSENCNLQKYGHANVAVYNEAIERFQKS